MICRHATCHAWRRAVTPRAECSASIPRAVHGKHDSAAGMRVTAGKHDSAAGRAGFYRPFKDALQGLQKFCSRQGSLNGPIRPFTGFLKTYLKVFKRPFKGLFKASQRLFFKGLLKGPEVLWFAMTTCAAITYMCSVMIFALYVLVGLTRQLDVLHSDLPREARADLVGKTLI